MTTLAKVMRPNSDALRAVKLLINLLVQIEWSEQRHASLIVENMVQNSKLYCRLSF